MSKTVSSTQTIDSQGVLFTGSGIITVQTLKLPENSGRRGALSYGGSAIGGASSVGGG